MLYSNGDMRGPPELWYVCVDVDVLDGEELVVGAIEEYHCC
jgi:hypothetical protein